MPYLSASTVMIHEEAVYQMYVPLPLPLRERWSVTPSPPYLGPSKDSVYSSQLSGRGTPMTQNFSYKFHPGLGLNPGPQRGSIVYCTTGTTTHTHRERNRDTETHKQRDNREFLNTDATESCQICTSFVLSTQQCQTVPRDSDALQNSPTAV